MSLGQRIKLLIKTKDISQVEFSRQVGVTRATVNQWIIGRIVPGHKPLIKIFELFPDISADWLLLGRGEMYYIDRQAGNTDHQKSQQELMEMYKRLSDEKDERIKILENIVELYKSNVIR